MFGYFILSPSPALFLFHGVFVKKTGGSFNQNLNAVISFVSLPCAVPFHGVLV